MSCACELKDFEILVLNRWGKIVHESTLKLEEQVEGNTSVLYNFEIPIRTLREGSYMYYIRRKGADKPEDVLMQGHFLKVE